MLSTLRKAHHDGINSCFRDIKLSNCLESDLRVLKFKFLTKKIRKKLKTVIFPKFKFLKNFNEQKKESYLIKKGM